MTSEKRLSLAALASVAGASKPSYDPATVTCGIVHLGVGAFHRAHQAVYVDDCLSAGESFWGILGASLRSPETRNALAPQDGLYTLAVQDASGDRLRIIGALRELVVAPEGPAALIDRMADQAIRIVTLTVTEKAYLRDASGGLDLAHPDIVHDLARPDHPRTVYGFLLGALRRRREQNVPPFTIACCDNLPANGETVKRLLVEFAGQVDPALATFVTDHVACPSTMVDRIVPATTDEDRARIATTLGVVDAWPVKTEPFLQWVVEDNFPAGRPDWERFGVTMVADVRPFEDMKLRLLNGAHSAIAYLGLLLGHADVAGAFGDPDIRTFVDGLWSEAATTLPDGAGLVPAAYTAALTERFSNPALVHRIAQIANDGSQKLAQRIIASARTQLARGGPADHLMLAPAAWIAACAARGKTLPEAHFTDPLDKGIAAILDKHSSSRDIVQAVFHHAGFDVAAGEHAAALVALTANHLETILTKGPRAALASLGGKRL
ncbi:mannitol dehydrogenase family protein [Rhizobiaceae bacterium n13]|uniref:Mannitol dehydrogenase family protein n=1 Tax=Ferirhizobium litorale TaxID=2927786 RepID=A0AAE3U133_9HYPH|nr:mannitol dehydrogenase family protein [Fererhizobium litorale]MDI7862009.1 mannitol dehydrogenase family protein [Fererhizobium litorale]MDI7922719.1 mannitol dehydrogenase family protein [Fererhizobium litorale]